MSGRRRGDPDGIARLPLDKLGVARNDSRKLLINLIPMRIKKRSIYVIN
jgi:hypothetical protein